MHKFAVAALLTSWISTGLCAEALITGQGQVFSVPDYIELSILVDSKCYSSPADARKLNDEVARKIVDFLNTKIKKKDPYNTVISSGGYTLPYQTYYQDKFFCQNTFQKQNTITFRTQDLTNFEELFNEIQNMVYKQFPRDAPSVIESSISYVTISEPNPGISHSLRTQLEQKAILLAFNDATAKLSSLFGTNKMQNVKITYASELPPDEPKPLFQNTMAPMAMMSGRAEKGVSRAPVQLDEQNITKVIYFRFSFDDILLQGEH